MNDQKPTFKEAMEATMIWCKSWENDEISDEVISDRIGELIKTVEGARGFFVVSLSIDCPLMDRFPDALIFQLRSSRDIVIDLTVKNLAMSSAMVITHHKNNLRLFIREYYFQSISCGLSNWRCNCYFLTYKFVYES